MSLPADSFERADSIFEAALDLPPEERETFLAESCGDEPELHALLQRLLAGAEDEPTDGELTEPLLAGGAFRGLFGAALRRELSGEDDPLPEGTRIGRYRLLRELGRGGMAVVYLAERADGGFDQQLAIKLLQRGFESGELLARFEQERQILAAARHPGIARLLDGGLTEDGRPYLAMEYVEGLPIDQHADRHRLTVRERMRLLLQVGRAIEDAHRNLVIHRDIKPSNILVTAGGHAKLLDFGIAKLWNPQAPGDLTRTASRLLTPAYASPEQVEGAPVTTASDVYQLGMLLYVLLAGRLPYRGLEGNAAASAAEAARAIARDEPLRLTAGLTAGTGHEAEARGTTPSRLRRELSGDLETIVATALRKQPERRYASVAQLLDDLERYLEGRPIAARPDTLIYRFVKFGSRHRAAVATAAVALFLLIGVAVVYTLRLRSERDRAERAAAEATQVAEFLRGLFAVSAPTRSAGELVTARQLLDQGAARIDRELRGQPDLAADMMTLMGQVYGELALYSEARSLLERAVVLRRRHPGPERRDLAASLQALARVRGESGALKEARGLYREALAIREANAAIRPQAVNGGDADLGRTLDGLGHVLALEGKYGPASHLHRRAVVLLERALGPRDPDVGLALRGLGFALRRSNRPREARPVLVRALDILRARYGPEHPFATETQVELGVALRGLHDLDGALEQLGRVLPFLERAYGPGHPKVAFAMTELGLAQSERGKTESAIPLLESAVRIRETALGPSHPDTATSLIALGRARWLHGDLEPALARFEQARAILEPAVGADHPDLSVVFDCMAAILKQLGRLPEARTFYEKALAIRQKTFGKNDLYLFMPLYSLAGLERQMGDCAGAEKTLRQVFELARKNAGAEHMLTMPKIDLARCLTTMRRFAEAEPLLVPLTSEHEDPTVRFAAVAAAADLYAAWGKPGPAARYRQLLRRLPPAPKWASE